MFEIGKSYRIKTIEGDEQLYATYLVQDVNLPLIEVCVAGKTTIFNTISLAFFSAELIDPEAEKAWKDAWFESRSNAEKPA